ncbi:MAG: M48 family metalloprotease [Ignavibacteriae bacterium]|nr:M48 family metalloprotease [Ignavibacteriota bacterium]
MKFVRLFLLLTLCVSLLVGGGYLLGTEAMFFGILISLSVLGGLFWLSERIVMKICNAELLTVYHSPTIFGAVKDLCQKANLPMPRIYVVPGETPNAFSAGLGRRRSAIAVTEGIISHLSADELRAVLAHELMHIKSRDNLVGSLAATFAGISGMGIGRHASAKLVADDVSRLRRIGRTTLTGFKSAVAPFAAMIIQSLVKGAREFHADERAARLSGDPLVMANAIRTMEKKKHQMPLYVSPVVAHLFTVSPLTTGRFARLFNTHPPMEDRIARLEHLARNSKRVQA